VIVEFKAFDLSPYRSVTSLPSGEQQGPNPWIKAIRSALFDIRFPPSFSSCGDQIPQNLMFLKSAEVCPEEVRNGF
jgi:hypothetical protein